MMKRNKLPGIATRRATRHATRRVTRCVMCCAIAACALCVLGGCRLAREDMGASYSSDRLIGVLITTKYLDLHDSRAYINGGFYDFPNNGDMAVGYPNSSNGRLYAAIIEWTSTDDVTGETITAREYAFEDIEGIIFCVPKMDVLDPGNSYWGVMSDSAISDGHTNIFEGDDETHVEIEGTIFVILSRLGTTHYFNPVYQGADGSVYAVTGTGYMGSDDMRGEGLIFTQTLEETRTVTENGKSKKEMMSVEISLRAMYAPEKIAIAQMDADNALIMRAEYAPDAMPDVLAPDSRADYIIVEMHKRDADGGSIVSRELFGRGSGSVETFLERNDGVCVKHWAQVAW